MENTDINISALENIDIDKLLRNAIKEKIEKLMEIELNAYLENNPGIKNGKYKRDLKTKYGEIKQLNVPRDRDIFPLLPHPDSLFHLLQLTMALLILYYTGLPVHPYMYYVIL